MNYDEGFIRGKAAFLLSASAEDKDMELIKELFADDDPLVNYQLIKGLFRSWPYLKSAAIKTEMKHFMIQAYDNLFIVLSSIDLLSQFSAGHTQYTFDWMYDIEDCAMVDMWYLWGELMPVFFKHLPTTVHINTNRFIMTFKEAQVPDSSLEPILEAFVEWLQKHIKSMGYHTSMAEIPIWFFSEKLEAIQGISRLNFIKKFLTIRNSVFQSTFWRYVVAQWDKLSIEEHNHLKIEITKASQLIRSVILTTQSIPDDLQQELLGFSLDEKTGIDIVELVPEPLLMSCLATLYLLPPFYDLPYRNTHAWNKVLVVLLGRPAHVGFEVALTVFLDDILVMRHTRNGSWDNPQQLMKHFLDNSNESVRETVFTKLLLDLMGNTSSNAKVYLDLLFAYCDKAEIERFCKETSDNIEAISNSDNLFRLPDTLDIAIQQPATFDLMVLDLIGKKRLDNMGEEVTESFCKMMIMILQKEGLKTIEGIDLFRTWTRANATFFSASEIELIEGYMSLVQEKAMTQRRTKEDMYDRRFRGFVESY